MWQLALENLDKILTKIIWSILIWQKSKNGLLDKRGSSGTECCLSKIEKLAVSVKVSLLQSTNIWVGDSRASIHYTNGRTRVIYIHEGGSIGNVGEHGEIMTASSIMDITRTWCNQFVKEQLEATLKDVQYNSRLNFNL